ncbi:ATP-binding cassette domain-containing protein [Empedobacter falsenii]|uniref:ATP-binding cassette domain-containing protein n=1 Tax=Empedobacter falsenii TaxID=343874 RepID=UPI0025781AF9|nr:ATP-binding cassette domain-containing protein [Empedobacter falsenii]MDM1297393.1 ATP-binding cassette domain-containing protein [Empedobacter falsenii]MDM1317187.1 ATP-binding cassette domain-containing protein [Empedobacter falsenii]
MKDLLLEVDSIQKSFDGNTILRNISFQVKKGEIVSIIGRNGSGKSTFFDVIFGSISAENKFVRINGEVKKNTFEIKEGLAFATQFNHFPQNIKVKTLIDLFINEENIKINFIEDNLIMSILNDRIKNISYGQQRYLQVQLYLYSASSFCILDEPFAGLSPLMIDKISQQIIEQSNNKGIIISDHQYEYVSKISTKNYVLKEGNLIKIEDKDDLKKLGYLR